VVFGRFNRLPSPGADFLSPEHAMFQILKPEYLFQPAQIFRRLARRRGAASVPVTVRLPWGLTMEVQSQDTIGIAIWQLGIYDLALSEVLWRLLEPGEAAVDVGGNIGYVSCLLSARAGSAGRVLTFEPHPLLNATLAAQVARWKGTGAAPVTLRNEALSDRAGTAFLAEPEEFGENCGTSTLEGGGSGRGHTVPTLRLDSLPESAGPIGVMKVDVEGHEASVFRGAERLLGSGKLRDIVFEEHHGADSAACKLLVGHGYTLFLIERNMWGPLLVAPESRPVTTWTATNFLATRDPSRALKQIGVRGWQVLQGR